MVTFTISENFPGFPTILVHSFLIGGTFKIHKFSVQTSLIEELLGEFYTGSDNFQGLRVLGLSDGRCRTILSASPHSSCSSSRRPCLRVCHPKQDGNLKLRNFSLVWQECMYLFACMRVCVLHCWFKHYVCSQLSHSYGNSGAGLGGSNVCLADKKGFLVPAEVHLSTLISCKQPF